MTFNVWTFLFEVINFLVLAAVLHWLLYRPLRDAIDQRRQADARIRTEAEKDRETAAAEQRRLQELLAEQEKERQILLHQARDQAEADRKRILAEAEATARKRQDEARQALDRERAEALQSLRGELAGMALDLTARLLAQAADRSLDRQLALRLLDTLRHLPDEERQKLRGQWRPEDGVVLESAGELNGEVMPELAATLSSLLGQSVTPDLRARPDLLGGVRLRLGGFVWDASLAGQLNASAAGDAACKG